MTSMPPCTKVVAIWARSFEFVPIGFNAVIKIGLESIFSNFRIPFMPNLGPFKESRNDLGNSILVIFTPLQRETLPHNKFKN